ncbi:MAG: hypothetical protein M1821_005495 [Bathelium mastoideum]|nr:MAG: hypothetical protein M1821_005495 [Bathelium mastoideum]
MVRVNERAARHHSAIPSLPQARKQKKPYSIVYEDVTQQKKKLRSSTTAQLRPPAGYTFVPAGKYPDLTERCKEFSRKNGAKVYVVSSHRRARPDQVSHHINRQGHHFQNKVLESACSYLGYQRNGSMFWKGGDVVSSIKFGASLARTSKEGLQERKQVEIAIKDLFPKIPEDDLRAIIAHAFEEGSGRIGTAKDISLERRVQLAVSAHIRHVYTDYDQRLDAKTAWVDARKFVESACVQQIQKWRGEDEDTTAREVEETFQEFIVINDDDDEDGDDDTEEQSSKSDGPDSDADHPHNRSNVRSIQHEAIPNTYDPRLQQQTERVVAQQQRNLQPLTTRDNIYTVPDLHREDMPRRYAGQIAQPTLVPTNGHQAYREIHVAERPEVALTRPYQASYQDRRELIAPNRPEPRAFRDTTGQLWVPFDQARNTEHVYLQAQYGNPDTESVRAVRAPPPRPQTQYAPAVSYLSEHDVPLPSVEKDIPPVEQNAATRPSPVQWHDEATRPRYAASPDAEARQAQSLSSAAIYQPHPPFQTAPCEMVKPARPTNLQPAYSYAGA